MDIEGGTSRYRGVTGGVQRDSNGTSRPESPKLLLVYLRRLIHMSQMDFKHAFTQMTYILTRPSKVYKLASWRYQTKNQWASDDPAFFVVLAAFIIIASIAYCFALGAGGVVAAVRVVCLNIALFSFSGIIIATIGWWLSNSYFKVRHSHSTEQDVEWMYALDIHNNAYFAMFMVLYVAQFFLLPILLRESILASIIANTLYAFAFSYYHFVSFLGYMHLPFIASDQVTALLYPIAVIVVFHVLLTMLNINSTKMWLSLFFD